MPKKPARNSFYFFMQHFKEEQRKKGIHYNNMAEVADAAGPVWKNVPPSVRTKFEDMAKAEKQKMNVPTMKFTSFGESLADIEQRHKDEKNAEEHEVRDIKLLVKPQESLLSQLFYVMEVNYYCRTTSNMFVVCEFTVTRFNLLEGIIDELHEKVDPGEIPPGYTSDAKITCDDLAITLPDCDNRSDYSMLLASIHEYLMDCDPKPKRVPPVFTMPNQVAAVTNFFQQLCHFSDEDESIFRVYKLDTLFFHLINNVRKDPATEGFPNKSLALVVLNKDTFQHYPMLACEHHETTEKYLKCTASRVKRWSYTIMDHCCPLQQIKMEPGKHLPNTMDLEKVMAVKEKQSERRGATLANKFDALETASNLSERSPNTWGSVAGSDITSSSRPLSALRKPNETTSRHWVKPSAPPNLTKESFPRLSGAGRGSNASIASQISQQPGGHGRAARKGAVFGAGNTGKGSANGSFELNENSFPQLGSRGRGKK